MKRKRSGKRGCWAVIMGMSGYMPNTVEHFRARKDAESYASELAARARDDGERVWGSAKTSAYAVGQHEYIEINPIECDELDAEEGLGCACGLGRASRSRRRR